MAQVVPAEDSASPVHRPASPTRTPQNQIESAQKHSRRLTTGFPVFPPPTGHDGDHPLALSPKYSSPSESVRNSPRLTAQPVSPTDPSHFLTTLAAQERRVLELREELQRAEKDLIGLKKQWATFEATRKRNGVRHVEQLQPLSTSHVSKTEFGGEIPMPLTPSAYEKLAAKPARKPQQRVFSGSRHTRTLSLLTPASANGQVPFPHPFSDTESGTTPTTGVENTKPSLPRSTTLPHADDNIGFGRTYKDLANRRSLPPPSTDALVKTGKQMASDIRDGLWTFFEDIRQATVGEEGINGTEARTSTSSLKATTPSKRGPANGVLRKKRSSTGLQKPSQDLNSHALRTSTDSAQAGIQAEHSFWKEFGLDTPGRGASPSRKQPTDRPNPKTLEQSGDPLVDIEDDNWDAWESPVAQDKTLREDTQTTENAGGSSLPFPKLSKLTPSKLTRTVSDLMRDWESDRPEQASGQVGEHDLTSPHG